MVYGDIMEIGVNASDDNKNKKKGTISILKKKDTIIELVKKILALHTLYDLNWVKAISSQYFLVGLAKIFQYSPETNPDYKMLLEESFSSIKLCYHGGFKIDSNNILIIPDENKKLINCMLEEDKCDNYYHGTRLLASKIVKPDNIYKNYHNGLMVKISTAGTGSSFTAIQTVSLDELFKTEMLDSYGGWYHYRLPWITARILIGLRYVDFSKRSDRVNICKVIKQSINSLVDRINDNHWRSGAGSWVSMWESTALCLEALFEYNAIHSNKVVVNGVINYVLEEDIFDKWFLPPDFSTEEDTNNTLATVVLSSVLFRVINKHFKRSWIKQQNLIIDYFELCLKKIETIKSVVLRQYCTIPQILYYITIAMKGRENSDDKIMEF